ncbi:MAG: hypothetical protein QJR12_09755 [Mycobacterium sp.]|uniref:hypothetical protein n=1 Tax=Mycobacterium sp. TaxID=1785 RepID=UPI002612E4B1|nr:hypothetical protein [Mycobacterium sp.]MDI3314539.1 hypothetical protein [Mycobacterium sp.]
MVYLDMLGFINLAELAVGKSASPGYEPLLAAARRARNERRAIFPLSSTHVIELRGIGDVQRRRERVAIIEELSGFHYMMGRPQIQELELKAALNDIPGVSIAPQGPIPLVRPSLWWAFGWPSGSVTNAPDPDALAKHICDKMSIDPGAEPMATLNLWVERELLAGPDDEEDPDLVAAGYDPQKWRDILEKRVEQERYLVGQLDRDPKFRQGRLRDVVNARELEIELGDRLARMTTAMTTSIGQLLDYDRTKLRNFTDRMPSTRVAVSLKAAYHKDNRHQWTTNDINDIDALSIAVPYCDAVFTDKAARNKVVNSPELEVFNTFLPRTPQELADWLDGLPSA